MSGLLADAQSETVSDRHAHQVCPDGMALPEGRSEVDLGVSSACPPVLAAARAYHQRGWCVVPVRLGTKRPACRWQDYQRNRPSEDQVRRWFDPHCGGCYSDLAVVLGEVSGRLAVRDFDDAVAYDCWVEEYPESARSLPTVKTARGFHVYFRLPSVSSIKGIIKLSDGELRSDGGIVLLPPSRHPSGVSYQWVIPVSEGNLREIDPEEIGLVQAQGVLPTRRLTGLVPEGQRNMALTSLAGSMRRHGAGEETIRVALETENTSHCNPPLASREVANIARSIARYEPVIATGSDSEHCTELGNARRLIARHGQDLRYVPPWKKWLVWDRTSWRPDDTGEVVRRAKETVASLYADAATLPDEALRRKIVKWAMTSEAEKQIRAMVNLAQTEPSIPVLPNQLDADGWLLNCANGTINLRTGTLRPYRREDLITKLAPVTYDPNACCPTWDRFLQRVTDRDFELQAFIQRAVGYALTGDTSEQVLLILHGPGQNGKSKFLEGLRLLLGDYALHTPTETLMLRRTGGVPNDLARLAGARLVTAVEVEDGQRLAESLVKQITGGDTVTARFLNREFFDFIPAFKLLLAANHKPHVRGTDHALWRRIRLIPFKVTIPEPERDKHLLDKFKPELPGILQWAVTGCLEWQRRGLGEPPSVCNATGKYREEMDVLGQFIAELCVEAPDDRIASSNLYQSYAAWCEESRETPVTQTMFSIRMNERGFERHKLHGVMTWVGIGLRSDRENEAIGAGGEGGEGGEG